MQHDLLYDTLRAKVSDKGQVEGLIHTYETLNRTTAPNIVNAVEAAGFEVVREYSTKTDIEPSRDLLEVYNYDVLTQEQLVILGRKN